MSWATLQVPASSANLGPGFDALGLALDLYLHCRFRPSPRLSITATGCDCDSIPLDGNNLIWQTALRIAASQGTPLPAAELAIDNHVPLGKGLGSSAAALTAGVVVADFLLSLHWSRERILDEAARLEGHPDNVAACVLGGITVSAIDDEGRACAIRFPLPPGCAIALVIPDFVLPTAHSRAVLPATYSREDTIFNLQRTGLLVGAFATGRTDMLSTALCDRVHQPFRGALVPGLADVLKLRRPDLFGCVLSGAGPSILVFYRRGAPRVLSSVEEVMSRHGQRFHILLTDVSPDGYTFTHETLRPPLTSL